MKSFPELLLNLERVFKERFEHVESEQNDSEKIIVILDRIDRLSNNFDYTDSDNVYNQEIDDEYVKVFDTFKSILKSREKNFRLLITLSTSDIRTSKLYKLLNVGELTTACRLQFLLRAFKLLLVCIR